MRQCRILVFGELKAVEEVRVLAPTLNGRRPTIANRRFVVEVALPRRQHGNPISADSRRPPALIGSSRSERADRLTNLDDVLALGVFARVIQVHLETHPLVWLVP